MRKRLAVCSWSLQADIAKDLVERVQQVGVKYVQLALSPIVKNPSAWENTQELFSQAGIEVISGMSETIGEDYSTLESIRRTGGIVPDNTWETNLEHIQKVVEIAASMRLNLVTLHAGFLPHDPETLEYKKIRDRMLQLANLFLCAGLTMGLETGQETADHLKSFLSALNCPNIRVNYDPANILLYGNGDPIKVVDTLAPFIVQCHIKDALKTKVPGTWGTEVCAGTGEVDWKQFFTRLKANGFSGDFSLERESGDQRVADLIAGKQMAEKLMSEI